MAVKSQDTPAAPAVVVVGTRAAAIVQWPRASVHVADPTVHEITLSSGRVAPVEGGFVVVASGEEVPAEAAAGQAQHCIEIGAAASVVVPQYGPAEA
jgi:hypothetical protein